VEEEQSRIDFVGINAQNGADLPVGERGIVIAPRMQISVPNGIYALASPPDPPPLSVIVPDATLSRIEVYQALMFWDRIATAMVPLPISGASLGAQLCDEDVTLFQSGRLQLVEFQFSGMIDNASFDGHSQSHYGQHSGLILESFRQAYAALKAREPGRWTIGTSASAIPNLVAESQTSGLAIKLTNAIPLVSEVSDLESYLRFLEDRRDERRRFMGTLTTLAGDAADSENPARVMEKMIGDISEACSDLARVAVERKLRITFGETEITFTLSPDIARAGSRFFTRAGAAGTFGLPPIWGGMMGAASSQFSVALGPSVRRFGEYDSPFSIVNKLRYPPAKT
jgi:hypothetical protein